MAGPAPRGSAPPACRDRRPVRRTHLRHTAGALALRAAPVLSSPVGRVALRLAAPDPAPSAATAAAAENDKEPHTVNVLNEIVQDQLRTDLPEITPGDTVKVAAKVVEGNRERIQVFEGLVMRMRNRFSSRHRRTASVSLFVAGIS